MPAQEVYGPGNGTGVFSPASLARYLTTLPRPASPRQLRFRLLLDGQPGLPIEVDGRSRWHLVLGTGHGKPFGVGWGPADEQVPAAKGPRQARRGGTGPRLEELASWIVNARPRDAGIATTGPSRRDTGMLPRNRGGICLARPDQADPCSAAGVARVPSCSRTPPG
jgi:hypothetical protein